MSPSQEPLPSTAIRDIRISGPRGERAVVTLEDDTEIRLDADAVLAQGLRRGDPVDPKLRATLVEAGIRWKIRDAGLRLLSHRARSRRELETRLRAKGFPARLVRETADDLTRRGYLDDAAFARAWVADRLRLKPRGRRALSAELRRKGVDDRYIDAALEEVFREEGTSELEIARSLAEGWIRRQSAATGRHLLSGLRTPESEKARRRFQGFMSRRGIPGGMVFRVLDELRERGGPDSP